MRYALQITLFVLLATASGATVVFAQEYRPLIEIPGVGTDISSERFIEILYILAIGVAAFVAVGRLVLAGFKYVTSSVVTQKTDAKKDVSGAIFGLIIILAAVTILTTINPSISNLPSVDAIDIRPVPQGEVVGGDENTKEYWREQYGADNYSEIDCNNFLVGTDIWITSLLNRPLNTVSCSAVCSTYYGGNVVGIEFSDSGTCVYPTDSDTYREKRIEAETAEIAADLGVELPEGATARACTGGRQGCLHEEEDCTAGRMLPDSQTGIPSQEGTGQNLVVVCTPSSDGSGDTTDTSGDTILYNGEEIDTSITYTIVEPQTADLPEGEYHGRTGVIVGVASIGEIDQNEITQPVLRLEDGTEIPVACGLIQPRPAGCQ